MFWVWTLTTCLICSLAGAAGVFNGTSAYLLTADNLVGSTPTYPVLMGCWVECADVDTAYVTMSLGDNVSGAYDLMELQCRGDQTNNPVFALSGAGGGGTSFGTVNGLTAGSWLFVGAYFEANNSRKAILGSTLGSADTVTKATTDLVHASIGARYWDSAPLAFHSGRIAEAFVANGFSTSDISTIVSQLAAGRRPNAVPALVGTIKAYQPLRSGLNDSGSIGPTWTNTSVTFDSADHPSVISPAIIVQQQRQRGQ